MGTRSSSTRILWRSSCQVVELRPKYSPSPPPTTPRRNSQPRRQLRFSTEAGQHVIGRLHAPDLSCPRGPRRNLTATETHPRHRSELGCGGCFSRVSERACVSARARVFPDAPCGRATSRPTPPPTAPAAPCCRPASPAARTSAARPTRGRMRALRRKGRPLLEGRGRRSSQSPPSTGGLALSIDDEPFERRGRAVPRRERRRSS